MNAEVRVWDLLVRVAHWTLVLSVAGAWLTAELEVETARRVHEWLGYTALAVIAVRLVWGWIGSAHARFDDFVRGPVKTIAYARSVIRRADARYLGHNPLGGWMVVALLVMVALAGGSGWLSVTDRFWGVEWVQELHETLANLLLVLAGFHIAGVIYTSVHHRENLVRAMITGRKRAT